MELSQPHLKSTEYQMYNTTVTRERITTVQLEQCAEDHWQWWCCRYDCNDFAVTTSRLYSSELSSTTRDWWGLWRGEKNQLSRYSQKTWHNWSLH